MNGNSGALMRRSCLLPAVALAALACAGTPQAPPRTVPQPDLLGPANAEEYLDALGLWAAGDGEGAERALRGCLGVRPLHVPSHLLRQDILAATGREEESRRDYAALVAEQPTSAAAQLLGARSARGPLEARIAAYQEAASRDAAAPWPRIALAVARAERAAKLCAQGEARAREGFRDEQARLREEARAEIERAAMEAERAAALAPDLAAAHAARGHVAAAAADLALGGEQDARDHRGRALEAFARGLQLDPGDPRLLYARALALRTIPDLPEAQRDLDLAAAAAPRDVGILRARARNLSDLDRRAEALEAWGAVLDAEPQDADSRVELGIALYRLDRLDDSLREFRTAAEAAAAAGTPAWKAVRGEATVLAQRAIDSGAPEDLAAAVKALDAYLEAGGPDRAWATALAGLMAGDRSPPEPAADPR